MAVNQRTTLRSAVGEPRRGKRAVGEEESRLAKRGKAEKARRDRQRDLFERVSCLFRTEPQQVLSRGDVLDLGEAIFLIDGHD